MRKIHWFTHTNIVSKSERKIEFNLSEFIQLFIDNELWNKSPYRTEYRQKFEKTDLEKIKSIRFIVHTERSPYSNFHSYESVLKQYITITKIERAKLFASGITDANNLFVIEAEFETDQTLPSNLKYKDEKDIDKVFDNITKEHHEAWLELKTIKSILCEFAQFFIFNLHLNFLTHQYTHALIDKPELIGFTVTSQNRKQFYEVERLDLLSHYILYEKDKDNLIELMKQTSLFWCKSISSIHFFLDALKGNYITSTNFIKLVFTIESFFAKNISNDYITLVVPLLISTNITEMKHNRTIIKKSFALRNNIVHGNDVVDFLENSYKRSGSDDEFRMDGLFFELKNILIRIFYVYLSNELYLRDNGSKINHELIFSLLPKGIK
ncbi:MAG TPA: hypothetical protein VK498_10965 [Ferruginibacter sp.]|nr:hypothetical protein [Ferruginibacter sp.]